MKCSIRWKSSNFRVKTMALFDPKCSNAPIDDTIPLTCYVETCENVKGFTEYVIRVSRTYDRRNSWEVRHRYNDFLLLNNELKKRGVTFLPLPPKKFVGNKEREFLAKRMQSLQIYLDNLLENLYLCNTLFVKHFLDPYSYDIKFQEQSLQNVSLCLRNLNTANNYDVIKPLMSIGWRIRKHFFLLKPQNKPKEKNVGIWTPYGSGCTLNPVDIQSVIEFYGKIQSSLISCPKFVSCTDNGALVVRELYPDGSIRDLLTKAKYDEEFLKKYCTLKQLNSLDEKDVVLVAKHLLEALKVLHDRGLFFGHLHCGNVALSASNSLHLLDIENTVLGLPCIYRPYMIKSKAIKTVEDVDVYCFGQTLYELLTGECLNGPFIKTVPEKCPSVFGSVLLSILSENANKTSLPSIRSLLDDPAFVTWFDIGPSVECKTFKITVKLKSILTCLKKDFEEKLHAEQLEYRKSMAALKVENFVNSDEQKQLRKRISNQHISSETSAAMSSNGVLLAEEKSGSKVVVKPELETQPPLKVMTSSMPPPPPPPPPSSAHMDNSLLSSPSQKSLNSLDSTHTGGSDRSALLDSIKNFQSKSLKKSADNNHK